MQLPVELYIYMVPGSILLVAGFLVLFKGSERKKIIDKAYKYILLAIPLFILLTFFVGYSLTANISKIHNLFYGETIVPSNPSHQKDYFINYSELVFTRGIAISLFVLTIVVYIELIISQPIYRRATSLSWYWQIFTFIVWLLLFLLVLQWFKVFILKTSLMIFPTFILMLILFFVWQYLGNKMALTQHYKIRIHILILGLLLSLLSVFSDGWMLTRNLMGK